MSTITLRSVKGSGLTNNEIDANFTNLNNDKAERSTAVFTGTPQAPTAAVGTVSGQIATTEFVSLEKEIVSGKSQILHQGTIVASCIDLPSKHSDGGAWIDRCSDKSWYNETLGGDRWIGTQATVAAAWTAAGSATGGVYQSTADNKFYTPTSSSTATEVFRGIKREYPRAGAVIIVEAAREIYYDLGSGAMWKVILRTGKTLTSVAAKDGVVTVGSSTGVFLERFAADVVGAVERYTTTSTPAIVSNTVNSVALTVLPNAPIDPGTGLPVPTIAVATAGGISVINDSGTVVNSATTGTIKKVWLSGSELWSCYSSYENIFHIADVGSLAASFTINLTGDYYYGGSNPVPLALAHSSTYAPTALLKSASGNTLGLTLLKENPTTPASGMVAYVTEKYSTGYMVGAIKGAYLADTTAETVTGVEAVPDPTCSSFTGLTPGAGWVSNGTAFVATAATSGIYVTTNSLVIGKTYVATITVTVTSGSIFAPYDGTGSTQVIVASSQTHQRTFVATTAQLYVVYGNAFTGTVDNISVKLAEPDRSVEAKGLIVNGSLTKTAVASGAGLVAWSGFSAANYLEGPYDSSLDFGTGDFSVMGWYLSTSAAASQSLFTRATPGTSSSILAIISANTSTIDVYVGSGGASLAITAPPINTYNHIALWRASGVVYIAINGNVVSSVVNTNNLTNTSARTWLGLFGYSSAYPAAASSLALWRISATAPSADQIAQIYRDELPLFQANAQCTLAGTSPAITALSYDEDTAVLHAGTSYGRSSFKGLLRVESEATTVGSPTSIAASGGHIVMGGTSAKLYTPAKYLRDELQRQSEAKKALGRIPVFLDITATSGQTAFVATKGYRIQALYKGGTLMRESTTGTYWTRSNDGYQETATLSVGATTGDWISMMLTRI